MNAQDLRGLLEKTKDKFNIFSDRNVLFQYEMNFSELLELIKDFLSDQEKSRILETDHFKGFSSSIKTNIILLIQDSSIKLRLLDNDELIESLDNSSIKDIIKTLNNNDIIQILRKKDFLKRNNIGLYEIEDIVVSMSDEGKSKLISNKNFIEEELKLDKYVIAKITKTINSEESKIELIDLYDFEEYQISDILETFSKEEKLQFILKNKYALKQDSLSEIISSLDIDSLVDFLKDNRNFLVENKIRPYNITRKLDADKQLEFIERFEDIGLTLEEKKQILVTMSKESKEKLDTSNMSPEYVTMIQMETSEDLMTYGRIIPDFNDDLEKYQGLDKLIHINPTSISSEERSKLLQLCEICPEINMQDNIGLGQSTAKEYRNAEIWMESILHQMDEKWSDIQKVAFIDNAIGKKISYSPDFDTEVFDASESRALWKIIDSGYGVCNGIAQVEKYIFDHIGIESEIVSSGTHSFLKLKNIEIETESGTKTGDTILDPTWNLTAHRYGAKPENFCRSYEETRKHDIRADGTDAQCHKNDEELESATLELDEKSLRNIFKSIEIADKDGNFPIKDFIENAGIIDNSDISTEEKIEKQFELIIRYCPEFAMCQNSTLAILQEISLNQKNFEFNRCVASRVYEKNDENKEPVMFVYADIPGVGNKFYFADKETSTFIEMSQKEFEEKFECYENDIEKNNGHRLWEDSQIEEKQENLAASSGKIFADKGDERL